MKYTADMGSGAVICIPSFIGDCFGHSEVNVSGDSQIHRQHGNRISLF
jgi:hypothetical protein